MARKSAVQRLMRLVVGFASSFEHIGDIQDSDLLTGIVTDPPLASRFRHEVLESLRHNSDPEDRLIVAEILLSVVDANLAKKHIQRAIMQEFVVHLAGDHEKSTDITGDLETAKERLIEEGLSPEEVAEREVRFHHWLAGG